MNLLRSVFAHEAIMPWFGHNAGDILFPLGITQDKAVAPRIPGKPTEGKIIGFRIIAGDINGKAQLMLARSRRRRVLPGTVPPVKFE